MGDETYVKADFKQLSGQKNYVPKVRGVLRINLNYLEWENSQRSS